MNNFKIKSISMVLCLFTAIAAVYFSGQFGNLVQNSHDIESAVFILRIKRFLLAGIAGGMLALSGVIFQLLLKNPLADPYVIGVSGGATLGAVLSLVVFSQYYWMTPICSFLGAIFFTAFLFYYGQKRLFFSGNSLLLVGVIANSISASIISFLKGFLSANKSQEILFWLMGYIWYESWLVLGFLLLILFLGLLFSILLSSSCDVLILGDDVAYSLGVHSEKLKKKLFILASILVGCIIPFTGMIGFVGLIVPHLVRVFAKNRHQKIFIFSVITGFFFLAFCDLFTKTLAIWFHSEPPVGSVTAIIGGPLFLYLLFKTRHAFHAKNL